MKKLRLDLDELSVESFDVAAAEREAEGTVFANAEWSGTCESGCCGGGGGGTNAYPCDDSIHYSCYHSCFIYNSCDTTGP